MLQNARVTAFTVSELLRKNKRGTQIRINSRIKQKELVNKSNIYNCIKNSDLNIKLAAKVTK